MLISSMFDASYGSIPVTAPGGVGWEPGKRIRGWCHECAASASGQCQLHLLPGCTPGTTEVVAVMPQSSPAAEYGIVRASLLETRYALKEARDECRALVAMVGNLARQHQTTVAAQIGLMQAMKLLLELTDNKEAVAAAQAMLDREQPRELVVKVEMG